MNVKISFTFVRNVEKCKIVAANLRVFEAAHAYLSFS